MTGDDEDLSIRAIEICRNLNRRAANECAKHGISTEEVGIAAIYSAFDIAAEVKGNPILAIEWMRTGIDMLERQLMGGGTVQ
jgi:hypothetical protein